jgi:2-oxoglutarate ferredoxin oxidoreductase subunit delta
VVAKITIESVRCKGCGLCVDACPKEILHLSKAINEKGYRYAQCTDEAKCIGCASCYRMCPDCVITVER